MKNLLFFLLLSFGNINFAQLVFERDGLILTTGTNFTIDPADLISNTHTPCYVYLKNISIDTVNYKISAKLHEVPTDWYITYHDCIIDVDILNEPIPPIIYTLAPGNSCYMLINTTANHTEGCAFLEYDVVEIDTDIHYQLDVLIHTENQACFLSTVEADMNTIEVYPNPAKSELTVNSNSSSQHQQLIIYSISGTELVRTQLIHGKNFVDLSNFDAGVLIYQTVIDDVVSPISKIVHL